MSAMTMRVAAVAAGILMTALGTPAQATPINLVTNGDFEGGNSGFASGYNYAPAFNQYEGEYTVTSDTLPWHFYFAPDYYGDGNFLLANGALSTDTVVWSQTVTVDAARDYTFGASAMDACCNVTYPGLAVVRASILALYANGSLVTWLTQGGPSVWVDSVGHWNSGGATSVTLELRNFNADPHGNDFAVDNIFFARTPTVVDPENENPVVPEPSTWTLMALGGLAAAWARRRQRRA